MRELFLFFVFVLAELLCAQEDKAFSNIEIGFYGGKNFEKQNKSFLFTEFNDYLLPSLILKKNSTDEFLDSLVFVFMSGVKGKITFNYNSDMTLNNFIDAIWDNGKWIDQIKHTNEYNSEGRLISVIGESFNISSKEWSLYSKDIYNYDLNGNRILSLHQNFNGLEFVNSFKNEEYFAGNTLLSSVNQHWIDNNWENNSKGIYTYSDNLKDTVIYQVWQNNEWVNHFKNEYEYDAKNNVISITAKIWQIDKWQDDGLGAFEYDVNNKCTLEEWKIASNNSWANWFRIFYKYNDNNNLVHLYGEEWINEQWIPENEPLRVTNPDGILYGYFAKEVLLYYSKVTSVADDELIVDEINLQQNYPNPFNPSTIIRYTLPGAGHISLKVYDLLGREVRTLVDEYKSEGEYEIEFNAGNLSTGTYIYELSANGSSAKRKMLLIK